MLHPCKHCAQHHANGSPAFSLPPRQRQYEQNPSASPSTPSIAPNTSRKKDRPSSPTLLPSPSNGSSGAADSGRQHTDHHLAIGDHHHHHQNHQQHHHRITAADSSSNQFTCRWLDVGHRCGHTDALAVQSVNRNEQPNISSISGQRRRPISDNDGNRCPSIPSIPHTPPTTCIHCVPFDQRSANVPAHSSNKSMPLSSSSSSSRQSSLMSSMPSPSKTLFITDFSVQNNDSQVCLPFDKCDRNTGVAISRPAKRSAIATASVAAFSHVLLFCAVFAVIGMGSIGGSGGSGGSGMVHASDPLRNSTNNIPKFSQESGSE